MTYFRTGIATVTGDLEIMKADRSFYQFIGWESPRYLEQSVFAKDFSKLKLAAQTVLETGTEELVAYRVLRPDESLHWVVAEISRESRDGQAYLLNISIQSMDDLTQDIRSLSGEIRELSTYIEMLDELFFRYDIQEDDFFLFVGGEVQNVRLFHGNLEKWVRAVLSTQSITGKNADELQRFCDDLRNGTRHFSHEIMMPHLIRGNEEELYQWKGRTISNIEGHSTVLGCVYPLTKSSRSKKVHMGSDEGRDELTGLFSKRTITDYIKHFIETSAGTNGYLCILDIDNFKTVNDNFGHMFGDEVLITVADIIKEAVGERGVAGRIGGDEMIIFLEDIKDRADLKSVLRTIRSNVEWAYKGRRDDLHLSCSMGAAAWPIDVDNYNDLFKLADKMLYKAKEGGKNRYIIYTADIHRDALGDVVSAPISAAETRNVLHVNKEQLLLEMTENFLHRGMWGVQFVLEQTGKAFNLARVDVYYDEPVYTPMHWRADGNTEDRADPEYAVSTRFRQLFNKNNLAVIDHVADLEFTCPEAYAKLVEQGVTAALFYRMDGVIPGYVTFFREEKSSRRWTEADKAYLNLIGKMIGLVIGGKK
ncbi:MAG: GGDEF domain-containing protein [Clostridium sp.]|nr:GGDEF domain-containing protein [Acetatifactor muris]MCM1526518.1 GGDEF domain-containing protein [Bacteroides sp.]MCM1562356.1 GGDEF domain-containing protein [Clostridium sp.]